MVDEKLFMRDQDHRRSKHSRLVSIVLLADERGEWLKANGNALRVVSLPAS